ncbi:MAG: bifunctional UDP-N-acetylmuramoyl-tripeptide:D-alanyl-D-alanine ligase/alanine racemase [Cytophagales bacterium]|nr:bifunctional UDP-N-acetylmuramoyl-tripeptide:D-alanyl-D-alanine ligase/alanine racemase [Cytophagales bacterium]
MMYPFADIPYMTNGKYITGAVNMYFDTLITDSRSVTSVKHSVFIAIKGQRHDGMQYVHELYAKGVRMYILPEPPKGFVYEHDASYHIVPDTVAALQHIAAWHRAKFNIPLLAITGSNAKTIIKEWLSMLISPEYHVTKSPKSYNSQIGVPLSVWQLHEHTTFGIFEAGISKAGEMQNLEKTLKPTLGLITNIGSAHDEGFADIFEKVNEKLLLFTHCDIIFYCKDHEIIAQKLIHQTERTFCWSSKYKANVMLNGRHTNGNITTLDIQYLGHTYIFNIHFNDHASVENIMHCITIMLYFGFSEMSIQSKLDNLKQINMRFELKRAINDCYLIDDTYNNDYDGFKIALQFLHQHALKIKKTLILSDIMGNSGNNEALYRQIADEISMNKLYRFVGIGPQMYKYQHFFRGNCQFFADNESFTNENNLAAFSNELILIKGGRVFEFEKIVKILEHKQHRTVLEIDLNAIIHNYNYYKSLLKPTTKIMVMVKSFAYGAGHLEIAQTLQYHKADYLCVAYEDEGVSLRENGITTPIMVLNPSQSNFETYIKYNLEPVVYNMSSLVALSEFANSILKNIAIHIEIDTGMHRLGFMQSEIDAVCREIVLNPLLHIATVYTHLAASDDPELDHFSETQIAQFNVCNEQISNIIAAPYMKHVLNSAGISRFAQYQMDMVRLGIGLYGIEGAAIHTGKLLNVSTLKSVISQIKHVPKQDTVGYNLKGKLQRDSQIAIVPIGYGDGYNRLYSNGLGTMLVNGKIAKVVGNVCMDMTMIDVTGIEAKEGDEVIIFGNEQPITYLAGLINTIPYEILTSVSERVKRVFYTN